MPSLRSEGMTRSLRADPNWARVSPRRHRGQAPRRITCGPMSPSDGITGSHVCGMTFPLGCRRHPRDRSEEEPRFQNCGPIGSFESGEATGPTGRDGYRLYASGFALDH